MSEQGADHMADTTTIAEPDTDEDPTLCDFCYEAPATRLTPNLDPVCDDCADPEQWKASR